MTMDHKTKKIIGKTPSLLEPYGNYVCVRVFETEEMTAGGVVLPEAVREKDKQMLAEVISVGCGQRTGFSGELIPCFSKPGDLVILRRYAPIDVCIGGEKYQCVFEGDILGKIDRERLARLVEETPDEEPVIDTPVSSEDEIEGAVVTKSAGGILLVQAKE